MVDLLREKLQTKKTEQEILEELLDSLLPEESSNQVGTDNMTSLLINFNKN